MKYQIDKLDTDNYAEWSSCVRSLLALKGLLPHINARLVGDKDEQAKAIIKLNVKGHHLPILDKCASAWDAWEHLRSLYQIQGNARKIQLKREICSITIGPK